MKLRKRGCRMPVVARQNEIQQAVRGFNKPPAGFDPQVELPKGFLEFVLPLHRELTPRQQSSIAKRAEILAASHENRKPEYLPVTEARIGDWKIQIPTWCADQRN